MRTPCVYFCNRPLPQVNHKHKPPLVLMPLVNIELSLSYFILSASSSARCIFLSLNLSLKQIVKSGYSFKALFNYV